MLKSGASLLGVALVLLAAAAFGGRRSSPSFFIETDQIDSGGTLGARRSSPSYSLQDSVGIPGAAGLSRSGDHEAQGWLRALLSIGLTADLNDDDRVDRLDLFVFPLSWKTVNGDPDYDFSADLVTHVNDRRVNEEDLLRMLELLRTEP